MATLNRSGAEISVKIVYYGPGYSGKTTNFDFLHAEAPARHKGDMLVTTTRTDRTLSFELVPNEFYDVNGYHTKFLLYTVPGQVYYNATRKLVLEGVDAVVFVADSSQEKLRENIKHLRDLEENLNEYGASLDHLPWVIQYNKRDLPDAAPVQELHKHLNLLNVPVVEAVACDGRGVYETFKAIASILHARLLKRFHKETKPVVREEVVPEAAPAPAGDTNDEVLSDVVDATLREVGIGKRHTGPAPAAEQPKHKKVEDNAERPGSVSPKTKPAAHTPEQVSEAVPKKQSSVELWAQSVGSANKTGGHHAGPAQPPASARERAAAREPAAAPGAVKNRTLEASPVPRPLESRPRSVAPDVDSEAANSLGLDPRANDEQPQDVGRLVEFDEDNDTVQATARRELPEFITDPMQRHSPAAEDEKIEHVERPPQPTGERGAGAREDLQVKVPVVISRSQIKKTVPLKLVLEIQVIDD